MPKRVIRAAYRSFRAPAVRYPPDPRVLFLLLMCVISGIPLIFADATPRSILSQITDTWVIVVWGIMLTGGALLTLLGTMRQSVNGVIAEQVGSVSLGFSCIIFAGAIFGYTRWAGSVVMLLVFGLGVACLWRWGQLQAYLTDVETLAQEIRAEQADDEL